MAEAHHGEGNVGMGPEDLVRRVDEEVEGPHFASQFGHCKFNTGVNMVKVLSTATAKSFTINEMACFGDSSMLNGLNIVHTTADYTALNNRLFTEKHFLLFKWPSPIMLRIMCSVNSSLRKHHTCFIT